MLRRAEPGFHLTVQALVDQELGEQITLQTTAPAGADVKVLAGLLETMRLACWNERIAANQRLLLLNQTLRSVRASRIAAARAANKELDDEAIRDEDRSIASATLKLEAQVEADQVVLGNGLDHGS